MSISVFDHPFLGDLFGQSDVAALFTAEADLAAILEFEAALARACARVGIIPEEAEQHIGEVCHSFQPDMEKLRKATACDGTVVPELIHQLRRAVGEPHGFHVHFGATSQDAVDTSFALRFRAAIDIICHQLDDLTDALESLENNYGSEALVGRTRMQRALPITVYDRVRSWRDPLLRHRDRANESLEGAMLLSLGGAVGTRHTYAENGDAVCEALAEELGLMAAAFALHTERDGIAEAAGWLTLVTGSLGKMGQDMVLMAQNELAEIEFAGNGGASTLPRKENPVKAEAMVALARFNAVQLSGVQQAMIHEQERSGAAWSLEWMILPQMVVATAASLKNSIDLVDSIASIGISPDANE